VPGNREWGRTAVQLRNIEKLEARLKNLEKRIARMDGES
jgi:hypothetical protein